MVLSATVSSNAVTAVTVTTAGSGYAAGDTATVAKSLITGASGSSNDLVFTVSGGAYPSASDDIFELEIEYTGATAEKCTGFNGGLPAGDGDGTGSVDGKMYQDLTNCFSQAA